MFGKVAPSNSIASITRRRLLSVGSLSLMGLGMPHLLRANDSASQLLEKSKSLPGFGRAKRCILLFMWGGPAHQDTWDLKPDAPREIRGEFNPIDTVVQGVRICEHFPMLARYTDRLAIIRSMTHTDVNHNTGTHLLLTGQPSPPGGEGADLARDWPNFGSTFSRLRRGASVLPPFVSMRPKPEIENDVPRFVEQSHGQFAGWHGREFDPMTIDADPNSAKYHVADFDLPVEIPVGRLDARRDLLRTMDDSARRLDALKENAAHDPHYARAFDLLYSAAAGSAFDLAAEPDAVRDRYGRNPHGQSVLQARRLIERGVPLVTVFWPSEGIKNVSIYWDTHSRNFIDLKQRLMPQADLAFTALLDDLESKGMLEDTLIIWTGEFGRTPKVGQRNSDAGAAADGRDHWPGCFTSVLAGGGIRGGIVHGRSDRHAAYPAEDAVPPVDLVATIYHCLGIPPELPMTDIQGRSLVICGGSPVLPLFAG